MPFINSHQITYIQENKILTITVSLRFFSHIPYKKNLTNKRLITREVNDQRNNDDGNKEY